MKHIQAKDHHHNHQFYNRQKLFLLAVIFLVILTTVPLYRPSINYTSFFFTTTTTTGSNSSSLSLSGSDDLDTSTIPSSSTHKCDIFSGEWIPNPDAPYYTNETCRAIYDQQNCMKYGRPDSDFMKWRWKPNGCELPVFNPAQFLELVRDKSLAFVGDSVARNHMQSLICLLSRVSNGLIFKLDYIIILVLTTF